VHSRNSQYLHGSALWTGVKEINLRTEHLCLLHNVCKLPQDIGPTGGELGCH